jgi:tmRNA-binding protein
MIVLEEFKSLVNVVNENKTPEKLTMTRIQIERNLKKREVLTLFFVKFKFENGRKKLSLAICKIGDI